MQGAFRQNKWCRSRSRAGRNRKRLTTKLSKIISSTAKAIPETLKDNRQYASVNLLYKIGLWRRLIRETLPDPHTDQNRHITAFIAENDTKSIVSFSLKCERDIEVVPLPLNTNKHPVTWILRLDGSQKVVDCIDRSIIDPDNQISI